MASDVKEWTYQVHVLLEGYSAIVYDEHGQFVADHLTKEQAKSIVAAWNRRSSPACEGSVDEPSEITIRRDRDAWPDRQAATAAGASDGDEIADLHAEVEMLRAAEARWIARLSAIREAIGDHGKAMLADLPDAIKAKWDDAQARIAALSAAEVALAAEREAHEATKRWNDELLDQIGRAICRAPHGAPENGGLRHLKVQDIVSALRTRAEKSEALAARMREALEPFARAANNFDTLPVRNPEEWFAYSGVEDGDRLRHGPITVGDLRRARAALQETDNA